MVATTDSYLAQASRVGKRAGYAALTAHGAIPIQLRGPSTWLIGEDELVARRLRAWVARPAASPWPHTLIGVVDTVGRGCLIDGTAFADGRRCRPDDVPLAGCQATRADRNVIARYAQLIGVGVEEHSCEHAIVAAVLAALREGARSGQLDELIEATMDTLVASPHDLQDLLTGSWRPYDSTGAIANGDCQNGWRADHANHDLLP